MMFNGSTAHGENSSIFRQHTVTLEDLPWLFGLGDLEGETFEFKRGLAGGKLKTPVSVSISQMLAVGQDGLIKFIVEGLIRERPKLIPFVFRNASVVELANYLKRGRSGSGKTLYLYAHLLEYFSGWAGAEPDAIISDVKPQQNGFIDVAKLEVHKKALQDYFAHLQDRGLSINRIANYLNSVKSLYRANGVEIKLPYKLHRRPVFRDRAPTQEELKMLTDAADLREKVMVSLLALGCFREGTLVRLQYRHVKRDLEAGTVPLHVHVEAEITKGKYSDYDTFLGQGAVDYLTLYLGVRRLGSQDMPPEEIVDSSPLIRDATSRTPKPIGEKQVYKLIHKLYLDTGQVQHEGHYPLRVHSLRKFFKTNLLAVGVQPDYVDYMMGHKVDTYHDVPNRVEDLKNAYVKANLSLSPKPQTSPLETLKAFARSLGIDPERIALKGASAEPHRVLVVGDSEEEQITLLSSAIKEALKKEIFGDFQSFQSPEFGSQSWGGGVARI